MNAIFKKLTSTKPSKNRTWLYKFADEKSPRHILKANSKWHYTTWSGNHGNDQSSDTLEGAIGDLKYAGAKVWSVLI